MNSVPIAVATVALLGVVLLALLTLVLHRYGPLPRKSPKRIAAGLISLMSILAVLPGQVRIEASLRATSSYHGPKFSRIAISIEGIVGLCLLFYFAHTKEKRNA